MNKKTNIFNEAFEKLALGNCSDCLEQMDNDAKEIQYLLTAIRQFAQNIYQTSEDDNARNNANSIINLIDKATKQPLSEWRRGREKNK